MYNEDEYNSGWEAYFMGYNFEDSASISWQAGWDDAAGDDLTELQGA